MAEMTSKQVKIWTCGNCGFRGNSHELAVHQAIRHEHYDECDDANCEACHMIGCGLGGRQ
jgi:hypothetical protein